MEREDAQIPSHGVIRGNPTLLAEPEIPLSWPVTCGDTDDSRTCPLSTTTCRCSTVSVPACAGQSRRGGMCCEVADASIPLARAWGAEYTATEDAPLLDLSQGVPGAPPHASYLDALGSVSATPEAAKYGPILGEDALRAALAAELSLMYKADITAHDMAITAGCNMAFYSVLTALTTPAENAVILPLPSYFNHTMTLSLCDVKAEYIPCDTGDFTPSLGAARELLEQEKQQQQPQPRIAAILLTSPNNPTGAVYTAQQLESWLALAREFHVPLILDETYRDFAAPHTLFNDHAWRDSLVSLGSFSSTWRGSRSPQNSTGYPGIDSGASRRRPSCSRRSRPSSTVCRSAHPAHRSWHSRRSSPACGGTWHSPLQRSRPASLRLRTRWGACQAGRSSAVGGFTRTSSFQSTRVGGIPRPR